MTKNFFDEDFKKNLSLFILNKQLKHNPIAHYHRQIDNSELHERDKCKKKSEVLLMNSFLHHFPNIKFENVICESPDFIAKYNDKKIGIELTEVINHLEMKKRESELNKIFRLAEIALEKADTTKHRGVYFLDFKNLSKNDLAENQNEIVKNIYNSVKKKRPCGVVKSIRKSPHYKNVFITHDYNLNLFDSLASSKIIDQIHKKNQKFPYYDRSVDECWLVIVSDMNSPASRYTFIQNKESLNDIKSPFDRIYHLESLYGNITAIK